MPDNAPVGATTVAADELDFVNGVAQTEPRPKAQRVKIGSGGDGQFNDATAATPLPTADPGLGADGDTPPALAANASGVRGWLRAILEKLSTTATSWLAVRLTDGAGYIGTTAGRLHVDDGGQSLTVDGTLGLSSAGDVAATLTDGRKTVTTPATAVALRGALACKWVQVVALKTNTQQVNVGGTGVLATAGASTGTPLDPGQSTTIPVDDAAKVFVDARVAGEGVSFTVGS
jgi:hypothetical protein